MKDKIKKIITNINIYQIGTFLIVFFAFFMTLFGIYITYFLSIISLGIIIFIKRGDIVKKGKNTKSKKKKNNKNKNKINKKKIFYKISLAIAGLIIAGLVLIIAFALLIITTAPDFDPNNLIRSESSTLYDIDGEIIVKLGLEKRELITYDQMPDVLVDAIIATEDSRFFQHNGFDLPRFMVASIGQVLRRDSGGASTLTMQVSKNNYTSLVSSGFEGIKRKFTDIYMSIFKIERNYTKEEILEFYANQNNLGAGAYGVQQASLTYFGKDAKDLNLSEASLIAGLFQAPSAYNPFINPESATKRRSNVLYLMQRHGYITKEEREIANAIPVESLLSNSTSGGQFQAFIDTVVAEVVELTGNDPYSLSMDVYTTMDREKQIYINNVMNGSLFTWQNDVVDSGIAVINNKDGSIAAIGAGRHRTGQRQFNNATMTKRQIGSTAKPLYDYAMGIENNNWSTYEQFVDEPHSYSSGGSIKNWDSKYQGLLTLREALSKSRNIPALKAFQSTDNKYITEFAKNIGLSPEIQDGVVHEAHALGGYNGESPLSMAAAYSVFANGGFYTKPYSFTKIIYKNDNDEFINNPEKKRVISSATASIMADVLVDAAKYGLGSNSNINGTVYGAKTGTSNFSRATVNEYNLPSNAINDHWVVGTSPDYAVGVWYGYDKITSEYFTRLSSREHVKLFQKVGQGMFIRGSSFTRSRDIVEIAIEKETWPAMIPSENTPSDMIVSELFIKGTEPTEVSKRFIDLDNPTNLTEENVLNKVTIKWDKIETPFSLDNDELNKYFNSLYSNTTYRNNALNNRILWNQQNIGEVGYNIYKENLDGSLTLLGFTKENKYEYTLLSETTIVIKSTYTIFKNAESSGVEIDIDFIDVISNINATLNGTSTINVPSGSTYIEQNVKVTEDGVEITTNPDVTIVRTIKKAEATVTSITGPGTYTVSYDIVYKTFNKKLNRIVIVE